MHLKYKWTSGVVGLKVKYNSTKTFDSNAELYWDELEQIWFCKKVGKLGIEYLPLWKNFSILYHIHGILNLVLAGNSNVVEITKESCNYSKNLPLSPHLEALNLAFLWIFPFFEGWNLPYEQNFQPLKWQNRQFLELLDSPTLISRKIWVTEKSWNFHTV